MARSATSRFRLRVKASLSNELDTGQSTDITAIDMTERMSLATGEDEGQADRATAILSGQIAPGATRDISLFFWTDVDIGAGLGKDALGQSFILDEIVGFMLKHSSGDGLLEVYASNPWDSLPWIPRLTELNGNALKEGGVLFMYQPSDEAFGVAGVGNRLRLGAVTGFIYFDLYVLGRHWTSPPLP